MSSRFNFLPAECTCRTALFQTSSDLFDLPQVPCRFAGEDLVWRHYQQALRLILFRSDCHGNSASKFYSVLSRNFLHLICYNLRRLSCEITGMPYHR